MLTRKLATALAVSAAACAMTGLAQTGGSAIAPKFLVDPVSQSQIDSQLTVAQGTVKVTADGGKLVYTFNPGNNDYPGVGISAPGGKPFDLSPWGHVEAKVTNTSDKKLGIGMRLDNRTWQENNTENVWIDPGKSATIKVIFGFEYGFKTAKHKLDPSHISQVLFYLHGKPDRELTFTIEDLMANGPAGETPPVDPNSVVVVIPENGNIFGAGAKFDVAKQFASRNASAKMSADGKKLALEFTGKDAYAQLKPEMGVWSLIEGNAVAVKLKNIGKTAVSPAFQIGSRNSRKTDSASAEKPIAPGASATIIASFLPKVTWVGGDVKGPHSGPKPGTGTEFESNQVNAVLLAAEEGAQLEIESVTLIAPPDTLPSWLGKQPPVPQNEWKNWKVTFDENFDKPLDLKKWNIYTDNYWDKRTHFSKDNNIIKDGKMFLRYEKKTGWQNDNPDEEGGVGQTDYACGHADTYGKWTQRYGYWEARMKLPKAPGLWPAFWTMPDRGESRGPEQWKRASSGKNTSEQTRAPGEEQGGMEFDIMEHLSGWGVYRFNQAFHWDGYGKDHKGVGSTCVYVQADKEGFITVGMLWLPGQVIYYNNGKEIGRWENERVCDVQSNIILYMVSGGWANTPLRDDKLPDDFVVDYVRVWQRADLATPEDGFKQNDGRPKMHSQRADGK